jgi:hypothetical protein
VDGAPADEPPADDPADDISPIDPGLFDPPAGDDEPEVEPAPADEPTPAETQPPAEPPTEPESDPLEGLFGDSALPADVDAPASDDPFSTVPSAADESAPSTATPPAGNAAPTEEPESDAADSSGELDPFNPFGTASAPPESKEALALFDGQPRVWTDASGRHSCEARLVDLTARGVVLFRDDGAELRINYRRLSNADLRFLRERIDAVRDQGSEGDGDADLVAARG